MVLMEQSFTEYEEKALLIQRMESRGTRGHDIDLR